MSGNSLAERQMLDKLGFLIRVDDRFTKEVDEIIGRGYRLDTPNWLDICSRSTFLDPIVGSILTNALDRPWLASLQMLGDGSKGIYCLINNPPNQVRGLQVQLWSSNARSTFYLGSHKHALQAGPASIGWLEVPEENFSKPEIIPLPLSLDKGGIVISDCRSGFSVNQGVVVTFIFLADSMHGQWNLPKIRGREGGQLEGAVEEMRGKAKDHGVKVEFLFA